MTKFESLLLEKLRILQTFFECAKKYRDLLSPKGESLKAASTEVIMNWVDALSSERESHFRMLQLVDRQIETERKSMPLTTLQKLQGAASFKANIEQILQLAKEIQLTDQSLFLYINNIGFEIRAQILKGLKEKEAISKFKSQNPSSTGEGFDQKA